MSDQEELSLREYSKRERMGRIREATAKLLADNSIADITMKDVAREARVGEATLFRYVGAKEELLLLVFGNRMEEYISNIEKDETFKPRQSMTGMEIVDVICEVYHRRAELYLDDPENVTDYIRVGLIPGNGVGELSTAHGDRARDIVERLITFGQEQGLLHTKWEASVVAVNCAGHYIHEALRSPRRQYTPETFWKRLQARLRTQLEPLVITD